jgi:penicillin V acylase-like amidase (Ntn superfamily)
MSSRRWRTVSDQKRKLYFFELALTPNAFWVDLRKLDLSAETGKVLKLDLGPDQTHIYSGEGERSIQGSGAVKVSRNLKLNRRPAT